MKRKFIFALSLGFVFSTANLFAQGSLIDPDYMSKLDAFKPDNKGFTENIPAKYSLRKWTPTPKNQEGGTCVGWGTAYASLSTQYNVKYNITNPVVKQATAFDPYFLYHLIKMDGDYDCSQGTYVVSAILSLIDNGDKRQLAPEVLVCEKSMTEATLNKSLSYSMPFRITDAYVLDVSNPEWIKTAKLLVTNGYPVVINVGFSENMFVESVKKHGMSSGLWEWNPSMATDIGGHCMSIIGFDDSKYGGAFEIMNSWGTGVGDGGYVYIKYADASKFILEAYGIELGDTKTGKGCQFGDCNDKYSRFMFDNGEVYEGELKGQYMNGWGMWTYTDGSVYAGYWKEGQKHGPGIIALNDNTYYKVRFDNGELVDYYVLGFSKPSTEDKMMESVMDFMGGDVQFEAGAPSSVPSSKHKSLK
jgi:hypothetical protein